jgi:hypothetical protein
MAISSFFIVLFIFIVSAVVIMGPFLDPNKPDKSVSSGKYDALLAERERLYSSIEELDLAQELDKISADDYSQSRSLLLDQAALVLAQIDKIGGKPKKQKIKDSSLKYDDELEQMIKIRRETLQKDTSVLCPNCKEPVQDRDKFCRQCGEAL